MASYVEKILLPDEKVICNAILHWIIYLKGIALTAIGGLMGFFSHPVLQMIAGEDAANNLTKPVSFFAMMIVLGGTALLLGAYLRQTSTELVMTNHRLIAKYGVVSRATYEIMANRITGANFDQPILGRILGFGTIWVHGAGGEVSPIYLVANPQLFYRAVVGVLERFQPAR